MAETSKAPKVIDREDGFFGVEGLPDTTYYAERATAERIAINIGIRDAELAQEQAEQQHSENG